MTTFYRWNPLRELITQRELDRAYQDHLARDGGYANRVWQLPVDAYTTEEAIVLQANVPGLKPEQLQVTLEGDTLTIRGELTAPTEEQKYLLHERPAGRFERILTINTPIDHEKVEANFADGVLTLTLPKAEAVKPKQIQIKATSK